MNDKNQRRITARDCAYIAALIALLIAAQLLLSVIPGVELVTVLFISFSFSFGIKRGMIAGVAFTLLRQLLFGFYPTVLIVYLIYYPFLALVFGLFGRKARGGKGRLIWLTGVAGICTIAFSMLDNVITPLFYGYTAEAMKAYFYGSLPFLLPQVVCTLVTVALLFIPLTKVFCWVKKW